MTSAASLSVCRMQSANARADAAALTAARESFRAGFKVLGPLDGAAKKKKKKKRGRGEEESKSLTPPLIRHFFF